MNSSSTSAPIAPEASTVISSALFASILAEAAASPDHEICGLLLGNVERIDRAEAARNVADDPGTRFEVDPAAVFRAHRAAREGGPPLVGHYHSHPSGTAEPSACDLAAAEPGRLWLIVAHGQTRLWLAGVNGFEERSLRVE